MARPHPSTHSRCPTLDQVPSELIAAIERAAERDAEAVAELLNSRGFRRPALDPERTRLPRWFLLGFGVAMRLFRWESLGIHVHREAGLPAASDVMRDLVSAALTPGGASLVAEVESLSTAVVGVFVRLLAWDSREFGGAEVVLDDTVDEEAMLDALAEFIWANRHARRVA